MTRSGYSSLKIADPSLGIAELDFSVRTHNRLRKMKISNLGQIARTSPKDFLTVEGLGRKCLLEIADTLERFYSELDAQRLASFADIVELWRPHFSHPERVLIVPYDPTYQDTDRVVPDPIPPFDPAHNSQAQLLIANLTLSARAENVLKNAGVRTLNELAQANPRILAKAENCGRKTLIELGFLLREYFASLPLSATAFYHETRSSWLRYASENTVFGEKPSLPVLPTQFQAHTVLEILESSLAQLDDRRASILAKRMGLNHGQPRKTLEAIGREYGLTRERVRQIVDIGLKAVLRKLKTHRPDAFVAIRKYMQTHPVVTLREMQSVVPNLGSSALFDSKACIRLLLFANRGDAHHLDPSRSVWVSKEITPAFNTKVLRTARAVLNGIPMTCERASIEVARSLRQFEDRQIEIIQNLIINSSGLFTIESSADGEVLHPVRQNNLDHRRAFIYGYIKEQGVPVHIREIFFALQDSNPELIPDSPTRKSSIHAIDSSMERDERFAWAGSSTWGLREWGYVSYGRSIAPAALEVLRASNVPLSTAQITTELSHLYRVTPSGVSVALKASEGVTIERNAEGLWRPI